MYLHTYTDYCVHKYIHRYAYTSMHSLILIFLEELKKIKFTCCPKETLTMKREIHNYFPGTNLLGFDFLGQVLCMNVTHVFVKHTFKKKVSISTV